MIGNKGVGRKVRLETTHNGTILSEKMMRINIILQKRGWSKFGIFPSWCLQRYLLFQLLYHFPFKNSTAGTENYIAEKYLRYVEVKNAVKLVLDV